MLNKKHRIGNKKVIEALFNKGKIAKNQLLIFKYDKAEGLTSQFAVIVSKKVQKKASKRNRLKRQIHEALRLNLNLLKINIKALAIAKPDMTDRNIGFQDINECVIKFFNNI